MTRINRIVLLALAAFLLVAMATPAFASGDDEEPGADIAETAVAPEPFAAGEKPVVVLPAPEVEEIEQPWTARFLIPLLVLTAIVLIIGVAIAYNSSIRTRYKVTS